MKNAQVFGLLQALKNVGDLKGKKFAYAVVKNRNTISSYIKSFAEVGNSEEFNAFEKERNELIDAFGEKDEQGELKLVDVDGHKEYIIKDKKEFDKQGEALQKKHEKAITDREQKLADFEKTLSGEAAVEIHMVDESDVPEEISADQLEAIQAMIKTSENKK